MSSGIQGRDISFAEYFAIYLEVCIFAEYFPRNFIAHILHSKFNVL